jgi:hypothetical protein
MIDMNIYYFENKDVLLARSKEYYKANACDKRQYQKEYYEFNKHRIAEYRKKYREANKDKLNSYRKDYYKKNIEMERQKSRERALKKKK